MFNLRKFSQAQTAGEGANALDQSFPVSGQAVEKQLAQTAKDSTDSLKNNNQKEFKPDKLDQKGKENYKQLVDFNTLREVQTFLFSQGQAGRTAWHSLIDTLALRDKANASVYRQIDSQVGADPELSSLNTKALAQVKQRVLNGPFGATIKNLLALQQRNDRAQKARTPLQPKAQSLYTGNFSNDANFANSDAFVSAFLDKLLHSDANRRGQDDYDFEEIKAAIIERVAPAIEEEVASILYAIRQMDPETDRQRAETLLRNVFSNWFRSEEHNTMPEENVNIDLAGQVLNNGLCKTAADHFGQEYMLYGPTEKRICPKLRGKGGGKVGASDVVSEYVCRHHCLDGIVIDDNKTVCGEAIWRTHVMDKFSREYVDEEGDIVGGYINRRFEINRNVPEENKMRLKPGETRKPRPVEIFGSMEARMQAMRAKEAENREYKPDPDQTEPFNWTKDIDQNNMEVDQKERDRREEDSGHKIVQYTKKDQQENDPKLSTFESLFPKTAQALGVRGPVGEDNPDSDNLGLSPEFLHDTIEDGWDDFQFGEKGNWIEVSVPPGFYDLVFGDNRKDAAFHDYQKALQKTEQECGVQFTNSNADAHSFDFKVSGNVATANTPNGIPVDMVEQCLFEEFYEVAKKYGIAASKKEEIKTAEFDIPYADDGRNADAYVGEDEKVPASNKKPCANCKRKRPSNGFNLAAYTKSKKKRVEAGLNLDPAVSQLFQNDPEEFDSFWESLTPEEQRIIQQKPSFENIKRIKARVDQDINESSDLLAIEG